MDSTHLESPSPAAAFPSNAAPLANLLPAKQNENPFIHQWAILLSVLLIFGLYIANNLYEKRQNTLLIAQERLVLGAQSIAHSTERILTSINTTLLDLSEQQNSAPEMEHGQQHLRLLLKTLQDAVDGIRTIMVYDASGTITESSRAEFIGMNFSQRPYFQTMLSKPEPKTLYVSAPFKTALGRVSLILNRATFDAQGNFSGVVAATLDLDQLQPMFDALRYTPDAAVGLVHGSGQALFYLSSPEIPPGTDFSDPLSFFSRHLKSGEKTSVFTGMAPLLKGERLAAAQTIRPATLTMSAPLIVIASQETRIILQEWQSNLRNQSILFTLLTLISVALLFFFQRHQKALRTQHALHLSGRQRDLNRLRLATEISGTGIWELDLKSQAMIWDGTTFHLYGKDQTKFLPCLAAWRETIVSEDLPGVEAELQHAVEQNKAFETTFRILRGDGEIRFIDARARAQYDEAGQPTRIIGVNRDITTRKLSELAIRESEERFAAFFEHTMVGMATTSPEKKWLRVNPALCNILGYSKDELVKKTWTELTHPDDEAKDVAHFNRLISGESDHYSMEKRFIRSDGSLIHAVIDVSIVRQSAALPLFFTATVEDISERKLAEIALQNKLAELITLNTRLDQTNNQLLQSEKLAGLGQLAAGVAHEINNPIGYVSSNLQTLTGYVNDLLAIDAAYTEIESHNGAAMPQALLRVQQLKSESDHAFIIKDIHHLLDESREGLERVRKIVNDLKDFSRVGESHWQRVSLQRGLESTLNIVWNEIKYKAELDREYADVPDVFCIPSQINQVFMNLLTNAAQSIEEHGHIVLRSGQKDDSVWIEIQDDGAGIAPENMARIFDPFFTTKPVGQGTGLGLSVSWSIIQRHRGSLVACSDPGKGTTFRMTLPIDQLTDAQADEQTSPEIAS